MSPCTSSDRIKAQALAGEIYARDSMVSQASLMGRLEARGFKYSDEAAFLLRYAFERIYVPVEMRYLTVADAGLAAVIGGWKLQSRKREYGLVLQGFGVAVMYLTAYNFLKNIF